MVVAGSAVDEAVASVQAAMIKISKNAMVSVVAVTKSFPVSAAVAEERTTIIKAAAVLADSGGLGTSAAVVNVPTTER